MTWQDNLFSNLLVIGILLALGLISYASITKKTIPEIVRDVSLQTSSLTEVIIWMTVECILCVLIRIPQMTTVCTIWRACVPYLISTSQAGAGCAVAKAVISARLSPVPFIFQFPAASLRRIGEIPPDGSVQGLATAAGCGKGLQLT